MLHDGQFYNKQLLTLDGRNRIAKQFNGRYGRYGSDFLVLRGFLDSCIITLHCNCHVKSNFKQSISVNKSTLNNVGEFRCFRGRFSVYSKNKETRNTPLLVHVVILKKLREVVNSDLSKDRENIRHAFLKAQKRYVPLLQNTLH